MSDVVIRVEDLSKQYRIGGPQARYKTIRESLTEAVQAPFRRLSSVVRGQSSAVSNETIWALKDVSFQVQRGEVVGIIGRNGAGKTTLLKILSRITKPTEGWADIHGRVGSLLEVGTGFHPELTGRENLYLNGAILGMRRAEIERKFDEIVAFAEIEKFMDTPVKHYSSGMYVRLAFAVAAHLEPEILLVDEVLAVGDAAFQKKCLGKMGEVAREGRTVLFVSHNMAAIQQLCTRGVLLEFGRLTYIGPARETVAKYEEHLTTGTRSSRSLPSHILFDARQNASGQTDFEIVRIEVLDHEENPKPKVSTWDAVRFRLHYRARHHVKSGSAVLYISTRYGVRLVLCSTQPDSSVPMTIEVGEHFVDCEFESLPLSAGEYVVGAALAIPWKEWLYNESNLGSLTIYPRDVFQSGLAPTSSRALLAVPHRWLLEDDHA